MIVVPHNDYVLCRRLTSDKKIVGDAIQYETDDLPTYEIVKISSKIDGKVNLKEGDIIFTNSIPTKIKVDDLDYFLICIDYIAGKLEQ